MPRHLLTPEAASMTSPPWNTYPRPRLRRDSFLNLNGTWTVEINGEAPRPILVPFPPESTLSGIELPPRAHNILLYRRTFTLPEGFLPEGYRLLLHFGAVDQLAEAALNGHPLGRHVGGYEPFCFDITDRLLPENTLTLHAEDDLTSPALPYGKQRAKRGGMWYTPVSGIWQTVWLEAVPPVFVRNIHTEADITPAEARVTITTEGAPEGTITLHTPEGQLTAPLRAGKAHITLPAPRLWSPEDPFLYSFTVTAGEDLVESYFALRTLETRRVNGIPRLCLNGKPYFFHALLDQGYYSDGIYTPAAPESYVRDILSVKEMGFNTLRKHIKVEPQQFYYDCDRLGMVVFQDMVNNGDYSFPRDTALPTVGLKKRNDKRLHRDKATREAFYRGMESTVTLLRDHPCICLWTIFNEGWGQFDGTAAYRRLRKLDPTRFIDTASGWFQGVESDVDSEHVYFKPVNLRYGDKPMILSEFGGYAYKPADHAFNPDGTYGYRFFTDRQAFGEALLRLYETEILPAIPKGLCAAVYTQLSDVEDETNGLLSYDRVLTKVDGGRMREMAERMGEEVTSDK